MRHYDAHRLRFTAHDTASSTTSNTSAAPAPALDFFNLAVTAPRDIGAHQSGFTAPQHALNGNAETGVLTPWIKLSGTNSGVTNVVGNVKTGSWSLFTSATSSISQDIVGFSAQRTYKLSAWVKAFTASGTPQGYIGIQSTGGTAWDCNILVSATTFSNISKTCIAQSA